MKGIERRAGDGGTRHADFADEVEEGEGPRMSILLKAARHAIQFTLSRRGSRFALGAAGFCLSMALLMLGRAGVLPWQNVVDTADARCIQVEIDGMHRPIPRAARRLALHAAPALPSRTTEPAPAPAVARDPVPPAAAPAVDPAPVPPAAAPAVDPAPVPPAAAPAVDPAPDPQAAEPGVDISTPPASAPSVDAAPQQKPPAPAKRSSHPRRERVGGKSARPSHPITARVPVHRKATTARKHAAAGFPAKPRGRSAPEAAAVPGTHRNLSVGRPVAMLPPPVHSLPPAVATVPVPTGAGYQPGYSPTAPAPPATPRWSAAPSLNPASETVTVVGRIVGPVEHGSMVSVTDVVYLVNLKTWKAVRGEVDRNGAFAFSDLKPGGLYCIVAWHQTRVVDGVRYTGGAPETQVAGERLSWHESLQTTQAGLYSLELSSATADSTYYADLLPPVDPVQQTPYRSWRRAELRPLVGQGS